MAPAQRVGGDNEVSIAVMGATGSGKSSFINLASGSRLQVSNNLGSCTQEVLVAPDFSLDGRNVKLIDTPGFDDTDRSDAEIVQIIAAFLETYYRSGKLLHGVLYFHRISDIRMAGALKKSFDIFTKLCGDDALKNVVIVTNMWSKVTPDEGHARQKELETNSKFFKSALDLGARITRHDNTRASALNILRMLLANHPVPLGIQRELVDLRKHFLETEAAQEVTRGIQALIHSHTEEANTLRTEIEEATVTNDLKTVQELKDEQRKADALLKKFQTLSRNLASDYRRRQLEASMKFNKAFQVEDDYDSSCCGCIVV